MPETSDVRETPIGLNRSFLFNVASRTEKRGQTQSRHTVWFWCHFVTFSRAPPSGGGSLGPRDPSLMTFLGEESDQNARSVEAGPNKKRK